MHCDSLRLLNRGANLRRKDAGDANGDGIDDVIVGASGAEVLRPHTATLVFLSCVEGIGSGPEASDP